jgi:hypothetical protein
VRILASSATTRGLASRAEEIYTTTLTTADAAR